MRAFYGRMAATLAASMVLLVFARTVSGQSHFTRITDPPFDSDRSNASGAAWIDFDGDDDLDLFVVNLNGANLLYENDGSGNLSRVTTGALATDARASRGLCWADYDNNGAPDVFLPEGGNATMLYRNDGGGDFEPVDMLATFGLTDIRGWACTWGDIDLDGFVDLAISHPAGFVGNPSTSNFLFRNRGDGTFEQVTDTPVSVGLAPYTVPTFYDHDLDGDLDLFIGAGPANGTPGPDFQYRNMLAETGTSAFERVTEGPIASIDRDGQVINWIDYDNDRDLDVYITNWGGANNGTADELYRNDDGTLVAVTEGAIVTDKQVSLANLWADFDNDGDLDVYVTDGAGGRASRYYANNGDGTFTRALSGPPVSTAGVSWGATAGDFDDDGDLDLFVSNVGTQTVSITRDFLFRNDLDNDNHWIKLRLVGIESNRLGIGAKVHARADIGGSAVWQVRDVSSQNSFNGHSSFVVHFGLGDATVVDSLAIEWPSGQVDQFAALGADQFLEIVEGGSPAGVANESGTPDKLQPIVEAVFPNPFYGNTNILLNLAVPGAVEIEIFDALGRRVARPSTRLGPGRSRFPIGLGRLPAGTYAYRVTTQNGLATGMLTKLP